MSALYASADPVAPSSSTEQGFKVSTVVFGVLGMILWGLSIGFMLGWEYKIEDLNCKRGGLAKISYAWAVSVPTYAAMIYVTARLIFLVMSKGFPNAVALHDLHQCVARMVAFSVLSLTMWAASLSWLVKSDCEPNLVYHLCNYGFIGGALVAGLAGGLLKISSRVKYQSLPQTQQVPAGSQKYAAPAPPQSHYNQAYMQPYRG